MRAEKDAVHRKEVGGGEVWYELTGLIVNSPPPDQARGVAVTDKVQSGLCNEIAHASMVSGNELSPKLNHITRDRPRSGASPDLVATLQNDHVMTGGSQLCCRGESGESCTDNNDLHA
jgi:hypothetical protein